jgi:protein TonB
MAPEQAPPTQIASEVKGPSNDQTPSEPRPVSVYATTASASASANADAELPSMSAEYLDNPPPAYPSASRRRGEQGRVLISALVTAEGLVKEAFVEVSSGFPRLDEAALSAVRAWRFVPAKRLDVIVEMRHRIPIRFELDLVSG